MSAGLLAFLSELYGSEDLSDCTVVFTCPIDTQSTSDDVEDGEPKSPTPKRLKTEPGENAARETVAYRVLREQPAHLLVVCGGSLVLRAQAQRWTQQQQQQNGHLGVEKPVLRVKLDCPDELPFAELAMRFIYSGQLEVAGFAALLELRKVGDFLDITGFRETCDAALTALIVSDGTLSGVAEVFVHRALLEDPTADSNVVQSVMQCCRDQLTRVAVEQGGPIVPAGPSLEEVLVWAFPDAPSLLSDPRMVNQLKALPANSMEALLGSDSFATDDEASVLLVLATWLDGNGTVRKEVHEQLCKLIRVIRLSPTYLHVVLPHLSWFPITPSERRFLVSFRHASEEQREYIRQHKRVAYDLAGGWYNLGARRWTGVRNVTSYDWHISLNQLEAAGAGGAVGAFNGGMSAVVCQGFEWHPKVTYKVGQATAGVFLRITCPKVLKVPDPSALVDTVSPGRAELLVYKRPEDGRPDVAWIKRYERSWFKIGKNCGQTAALELLPRLDCEPTPSTQQLIERQWERHLHEGKLKGQLRWY